MKAVVRALDTISDLGMWLGALCVLAMTALIVVEVVGRTFFSFTTLVADEYAGYLLAALTFLGLAYTLRVNGFVRMEVVFNRLPAKVRQVWGLTTVLLSLVYVGVLDYQAVEFLWDAYAKGVASAFVTRTPLFIPLVSMPLGATLLALQLLALMLRSLAGPEAEVGGLGPERGGP